MKVCKFGGTSLASADQIRKVCDIILSDSERRIIIVSAPGKRNPTDIKVTDLLIALSNAIISGYSGEREIQEIAARYSSIAEELNLKENYSKRIEKDLKARIETYMSDHSALIDALKAAGEDHCAQLITLYLQSLGIPSAYVNPKDAGLYLEMSVHGGVVAKESYENLAKLRKRPEVLIFPGFFGFHKETQKILTFPRGGSDITGSILAAAVDADLYENWTDVDHVYSVNPALVEKPHPIKELTYTEMRELAYAGFSVIHEEALEPVLRSGIPLEIRNTNNPKASGTRITNQRKNYDSIVTGIAGSKGFTILHIQKYLMNREVGFAAKVLDILEELNIPFDHMPSGIDSLSIVMREEVFTAEKERIVLQKIQETLEVDHLHVQRGIAIVMIVGAAMAQTVGVASKAVRALSTAGINLELIIQAASEISVLFGVRQEFCDYAITELYRCFFGKL